MPSITASLIAPLQAEVGLVRGIETGAFRGEGIRRLAQFLPEVLSIELSPHYQKLASAAVADIPHAKVVQGHSAEVIPRYVDASKPTLWFLDGHWSTGDTAGASDQCPVLREIAAMKGSNDEDVVVVDDARLFLVSPPPPQDPARWPVLLEVLDALRSVHPNHHVSVINDQIIAVPSHARVALDEYALSPAATTLALPDSLRAVARSVKHRRFSRIGKMH